MMKQRIDPAYIQSEVAGPEFYIQVTEEDILNAFARDLQSGECRIGRVTEAHGPRTPLPFPTWRDLADTLASPDPDQRVTDDDPGFWVGLWLQGVTPGDAVMVTVEF